MVAKIFLGLPLLLLVFDLAQLSVQAVRSSAYPKTKESSEAPELHLPSVALLSGFQVENEEDNEACECQLPKSAEQPSGADPSIGDFALVYDFDFGRLLCWERHVRVHRVNEQPRTRRRPPRDLAYLRADRRLQPRRATWHHAQVGRQQPPE